MSDSDDETPSQPKRTLVDDNAGLHPLFWDAMPEEAEKDPTWQALEALKEESTPEERANNFKMQGNNKLRVGLKSKNKHVLREAVQLYTQGLEVKCQDSSLNAVILCNRAHVESLLGNWRSCLNDSQAARKLDPSNVKAHFRGAKAALQLKQYELCVQLCQEGQRLDPNTAEFAALLKEAAQKDEEEKEKARALAAKKEAELAPSKRLADAICARGWKVTLPQIRLEDKIRPHLDQDRLLHWPVVIIYPENMQQDAIEDFCETQTVAAHLDVMFAPDAPPLTWDTRNEYTRKSIELYYLSYAGKPLEREQLVTAMHGQWPEGTDVAAEYGPKRYGKQAATWQLVDQRLTLGEILSRPDYVVPGVPLFFAVAKGTEYRTRFLAQNLKA